MRDQKLVEPFAVPEIFVDGFTDHIIRNGVMTCAGYRLQEPAGEDGQLQRVAVIRLVMPAANLNDAIEDARSAQSKPAFTNAEGNLAQRH